MDNNRIAQIAKLQAEFGTRDESPNEIYHYTGIDIVPKILAEAGVVLRLTRAEKLLDQHEGRRTVEVYYDLALERLLTKGDIDESVYEILAKIEVPQKILFLQDRKRGSKYTLCAKSKEYKAYTFCFSAKENDQYMISNYIPAQEHKGYCLSFFGGEVRENTTTIGQFSGARFRLEPVIYGGKIVDRLYYYLKSIVSIVGSSAEDMQAWLKPLVLDALSSLRYRVKLGRYSEENEIRFIVFLPKGKRIKVKELSYGKRSDGEGHYIYLTIPKGAFCGLTPTETVSEEEHNIIREAIVRNNYRILI